MKGGKIIKQENSFTFEDIFKQNERRIHYHIQKLHLQDPHREYYVEGIYALWVAYKKYEPDKGPMSTYFNYTIRNHLIDKIRKEKREQDKKEKMRQEVLLKGTTGNRHVRTDMSLPSERNDGAAEEVIVEELLEQLPALLTEKQMKWVMGRYIHGMSIREIAEQEGVTEFAVKSWGREVRKKLRSYK